MKVYGYSFTRKLGGLGEKPYVHLESSQALKAKPLWTRSREAWMQNDAALEVAYLCRGQASMRYFF
jgi:hypothetical protein